MHNSKSISIANLASSVVDTGRRGMPKPGCDCVQCFGYCSVDHDQAQRDVFLRGTYSELERTRMSEGSRRALDLEPVA